MNTYKLISAYWDMSSENPGQFKPAHSALYFYIMYLANKFGWKQKFGLPTLFAMEQTNIRSRHTLNKLLKDLEDFGLIKIVEESKNQHTAKIVAMIKTYKADDIADDMAHIKADDMAHEQHISRQVNGTYHDTGTIDKLINNKNNKTINNKTTNSLNIPFDDFWDAYDHKVGSKEISAKKWSALKDEERKKIMDHIPIYTGKTPDKKYRKQPSTYLNQKVWESEDEWNTIQKNGKVPDHLLKRGENESWEAHQRRLLSMFA